MGDLTLHAMKADMSKDRREKGRRGEDEACRFLRARGYRIMDRNYRCPLGEIDIVAKDEKTLVFVEVKSNVSARSLPPRFRIGKAKRRKLTQLAHYYIKQKGLEGQSARFDVVEVSWGPDGQARLDVICNAFEACPWP